MLRLNHQGKSGTRSQLNWLLFHRMNTHLLQVNSLSPGAHLNTFQKFSGERRRRSHANRERKHTPLLRKWRTFQFHQHSRAHLAQLSSRQRNVDQKRRAKHLNNNIRLS
jgi:hypothetical protein